MTLISKIGSPPKSSILLAALSILLRVAATTAQTLPEDVGLVTKLTGEAVYWNKNESRQPALVQSFMKVRLGDHLKLLGPASLQVIYFVSGRQEAWKGPGTIVIGDRGSTAVADNKPSSAPEVLTWPTKATRGIGQAPLPLPRSSNFFSGVIYTRGSKRPGKPAPINDEEREKIDAAKNLFLKLKSGAKPDDLTPELYYLAVLGTYQQYAEMDNLITQMQLIRPGDLTLKELKSWVCLQSMEHE
jgi:hypothetical protein